MSAAETNASGVIVVKIGGSTLGSHDTTLEDLVALQQRGARPVVVHGGGALISEWLSRHDVPTRFERGLRVTDAETLKVVVAVLAGLVNKELVAAINATGGRAVGLSGADGGLLRARIADEALGYVGEITRVEAAAIESLLEDGVMPVIAPIAVLGDGEALSPQLLNVNADTAAGAIAAALGARRLVFLTDVAGVRSIAGDTLTELSAAEAEQLISAGVIEGGMIPKVEACLEAARAGAESTIADGRHAHVLLEVTEGRAAGTAVR